MRATPQRCSARGQSNSFQNARWNRAKPRLCTPHAYTIACGSSHVSCAATPTSSDVGVEHERAAFCRALRRVRAGPARSRHRQSPRPSPSPSSRRGPWRDSAPSCPESSAPTFSESSRRSRGCRQASGHVAERDRVHGADVDCARQDGRGCARRSGWLECSRAARSTRGYGARRQMSFIEPASRDEPRRGAGTAKCLGTHATHLVLACSGWGFRSVRSHLRYVHPLPHAGEVSGSFPLLLTEEVTGSPSPSWKR